jgi:hypothetical protein
MFGTLTSRWITFVVRALVVVMAVIVLPLGSMANAAQACKTVKGKLIVRPLTGPDCHSSVGLCSQGTIKGDIDGDFLFVATSLTATADTPTTSVLQFTGDSVIHTTDGDLMLKDSGAVSTEADGYTIDLAVITSGSGRLSGASGALRITGTFTPPTGGESNYAGQICRS